MTQNEKLDLFKLHKNEYAARLQPSLVTIGPGVYLAIEGQGEPGGEEFQAKVGALYAGAYTIKFASKASGRDFVVCKLEATWWADEGGLSTLPQKDWRWSLMIRLPDFIGDDNLRSAVEKISAKKTSPEITQLKLETLSEGLCIQALHVGSYDQEAKTIEGMQALAAEKGLRFHGRHHEIYLSDPRRVEPARLKTILRNPVQDAD
jgi:hypothetical protein